MMVHGDRHHTLIEMARDFILQPSVTGQEGAMARTVVRAMERMGFSQVRMDDAGNVVGKLQGQRPGKTILLDAHMDTVPIAHPRDWTQEQGALKEGKLYGRGASDMKGSLAAMISGASFLAKDTKGDFAGEIVVSGTVMEECLEGVAARVVSQAVKPDMVIIGEATDLQVATAQRGRAELVLETHGKPAHSASPQYGINAVYAMMTLLTELRKRPRPHHPLLGEGIMELTDIRSEPYPGLSVIPPYCRATMDRRLLPGEDEGTITEELEGIWSEEDIRWTMHIPLVERETWKGGMLRSKLFFPPWIMDEEHPLILSALRGLRKQGFSPQRSHYSFCTNGSHYAGEAHIPTIGFGPSQEHLAHSTDEYIDIEDLLRGCRGYYGILQELLMAQDH